MSAPKEVLRIGALARLCEVSPDTLRHYERMKLLRAAVRTPAGYRLYGPEAIARVRTIQAALSLGFTLAELARLLGMRDAGRPPCQAVRALAREKLLDLERHLEDVVRLRAGLRAVLADWDARLDATPSGARAGLLDALASGQLALNLPHRSLIKKESKHRSMR